MESEQFDAIFAKPYQLCALNRKPFRVGNKLAPAASTEIKNALR